MIIYYIGVCFLYFLYFFRRKSTFIIHNKQYIGANIKKSENQNIIKIENETNIDFDNYSFIYFHFFKIILKIYDPYVNGD